MADKQTYISDTKTADHGLVSIIMPNYNGEKFLRETIDSVISQTYQNWEILLVDDCSTDSSLEIARSYGDSRIRTFKNEQNGGAAVSRNYALREARGEWIAFLDSDDLWRPEKLERQLNFMVENNYHFSYTEYSHIDEQSQPLNVRVTGPKKIGKLKMFCYDYMGCLTVMYNAQTVGQIQVEPSLKSRNDYAMWLKVCRKCKCYMLREDLAEYRIRKNSLSHSGLKKSIKNQYRLFRVGEGMCAVRALFHTAVNMFFGVLKKLIYVREVK